MNKENTYERLEMEIVIFQTEDIITSSPTAPEREAWETPIETVN